MAKRKSKRMFRTLIAAVLSISLLQGCGTAQASTQDKTQDAAAATAVQPTETAARGASDKVRTKQYYPEDKEHIDVTMDQVPRDSFDREAYQAALDEARELSDQSGSEEAILADLDILDTQYANLMTDYSMVQYDYYCDVSRDDASEKVEEMEQESLEVWDEIAGLLRDLLQTEYADTVREKFGDEAEADFADYEDMTEEEEKVSTEISSIAHEYDNLLLKEPTDQEEWDEWAASIKEIYCKLLQKEAEAAEIYGYDDYYQYTSEEAYSRDYETEDIRKLAGYVKKYTTEALSNLLGSQSVYNAVAGAYVSSDAKAEDYVELFAGYPAEISDDLEEAYDYLQRNHLYDMDASDSKMDTGYTIDLASYGGAYIFDNPYQKLIDFDTLVHEFGHYAHFYADDSDQLMSVSNLDVCEIHSQGLELMMYPWYEQIFSEDHAMGVSLKYYVVYNVLRIIPIAFCVDEFERTAMENPDMTAEELDELADKLGKDYDCSEDFNSSSWFYISHIFESPGYYLSYGTSALAALEILEISQEDYDKACQTYMTLSAMPTSVEYCQALEDAGLPDVFEEKNVEAISDTIDQVIADAKKESGEGGLPDLSGFDIAA